MGHQQDNEEYQYREQHVGYGLGNNDQQRPYGGDQEHFHRAFLLLLHNTYGGHHGAYQQQEHAHNAGNEVVTAFHLGVIKQCHGYFGAASLGYLRREGGLVRLLAANDLRSEEHTSELQSRQ